MPSRWAWLKARARLEWASGSCQAILIMLRAGPESPAEMARYSPDHPIDSWALTGLLTIFGSRHLVSRVIVRRRAGWIRPSCLAPLKKNNLQAWQVTVQRASLKRKVRLDRIQLYPGFGPGVIAGSRAVSPRRLSDQPRSLIMS
jgi:hypothetical protein